jgi:hypothetical protein
MSEVNHNLSGTGRTKFGWMAHAIGFFAGFFPTYFFLLEERDVGLPRRMERTSFKR